MTTFLERIAPDLVIGSVVGSLGSYGLDALYPSPDRAFLVVACTAAYCATEILGQFVVECATALGFQYGHANSEGEITNQTFKLLGVYVMATSSVLLPLLARYVGQKAGYRVPDSMQMLGYTVVVSNLCWMAKNTYAVAQDSYNRYYPSPAVK